jgi:predicted pyridoxine 5'-phosphate oxidase superfamily flavin-nucleotide-binding protein
MRLGEAARRDMAAAVLCWLATADARGRPNVSPKEIWAPLGEEAVAVADIASPVTVRNLRANPFACLSFVDVFRQCGWKIEGPARVVARGEPGFAEAGARLLELAGPEFPVRHAVVVEAERVSRILAPSYRIFPDRTEAEQVRRAHAAYRVRPAGDG